jgi:hypothetical protein
MPFAPSLFDRSAMNGLKAAFMAHDSFGQDMP